jgi:alpha-beta hydrolase superfamily lysophospholipase
MTGAARIDGGAFIARDGAKLPLRRWAPDTAKTAPIAALVALHGFNDYSSAFEDAAKFWATKGVVTYAIDQRGFGRSAHTGLWAGVDTMVNDAEALVRTVRARHPKIPLHIIGDSMGGAVAMVALARHKAMPMDGAILVAPAVWGRRHLGAVKRGVLWLTANTVPWLRLSPEGLEIQPSDNIAMLRKLSKDKLIIKKTRVDAIWGLVNLMDAAFDAATGIKAPVLLLYGARDEVIPKEPTRKAAARLRAKGRTRAAFYANGYHMLLRDLRARDVLDDVLIWIKDHDAALPSGAEKAVEDWLKKKD